MNYDKIKDGLKSNDIEIIALYSELALEKYNENQINNIINNKYYITLDDDKYFYLFKKSTRGGMKGNKIIKLNFKPKKIDYELQQTGKTITKHLF